MAAKTWAPWVRLNTPSVTLKSYVSDFVLHVEEGLHPWAQLTVRYYLANSFKAAVRQLPASLWWPDNAPVSVSYGATSADSATFTGYVISPELMNDPGQRQLYAAGQILDIRYTLLGTSSPLQTAKTYTWRTCTVAYMAQQIAQKNGLASVTDTDSRVFANRQQASQSDFSFLQARATETGKRLVVDGVTLCLTDPRRPLVSGVPKFSQNRTAGRYDTMRSFRAVVGELDPSGAVRAHHAVSGVSSGGVFPAATAAAARIDPVSGTDVSPRVTRYESQYVARSYADAVSIAGAAAVRDLWWVHASATVDGDVRLRPGCVVSLGGSAVPDQYAGQWMTKTAHHRFSVNLLSDRFTEYFVDLELGRDQVSSLSKLPAVVAASYTPVLAGGKWAARRAQG